MRTKSAIATALAVVSFAAQGCDGPSAGQDPQPELGSTVSELIGGVEANSAALDAIGSLGLIFKEKDCDTGGVKTTFIPYCTASLISAQTIVTAKHCVDALKEYQTYYGLPSGFGIGADGNNPKRIVPAVESQRAPGDEGGFVGLGRDVGVAHLEQAVTDLTPLKFAKLPASAIGKRYGAIGYGVQDNTGKSGTRLAGSVTINATSGRIFELIFGSYEAFKHWYLTGSAPEEALAQVAELDLDAGPGLVDGGPGDGDAGPDEDWLDEYLREVYENTFLLDGYEAYVGNQDGDAQICFGDSGSPLVKANGAGQLVAYGVVSGGIGSNDSMCDYGGTYATFGPDINEWLKKVKGWKDPCKGISADGLCDDDRAKRCTTIAEGKRRLTVTDCSLFAQTCAIASNDEAVCVTPGEDPVVLPEPELPDNCFPEDGWDGSGGDGDGDGSVDSDGDDGDGSDGDDFASRIRARISKSTRGPLAKIPSQPTR